MMTKYVEQILRPHLQDHNAHAAHALAKLIIEANLHLKPISYRDVDDRTEPNWILPLVPTEIMRLPDINTRPRFMLRKTIIMPK